MYEEKLTLQELMIQNEMLAKDTRHARFATVLFIITPSLVLFFWYGNFAMFADFSRIMTPLLVIPPVLNVLSWLYFGLLALRSFVFGRRRFFERERFDEPGDPFREHEARQFAKWHSRHMQSLATLFAAAQFVTMGVLLTLRVFLR